MISAMSELVSSGITAATRPDLFETRPRATRSGVYAVFVNTCVTRARVAAATLCGSCSTRTTVIVDTPAARATSNRRVRPAGLDDFGGRARGVRIEQGRS